MNKWLREFLGGLLQQITASWFLSSTLGKTVVSAVGAFLLALWSGTYALPPPILVALAIVVFVAILDGLTLLSRRDAVTPLPTSLRLQFNAGNVMPLAIEERNIWRWYALAHVIRIVRQTATGQTTPETHKEWTLFLVFEKPIPVSQVRIDSGGAVLPAYEVKDFGPRHAIIAFGGDLAGFVLGVEILF